MALLSWCVVSLASLLTQTNPPIAVNDNRVPAGVLTHGVLTVSLIARLGDWHPFAPDRGTVALFVFGESGKPLQDPGPLFRVPLGTRVRARVQNLTGATLVVHGLAARHVAMMDSLVLAPGATGAADFTTDTPGTFYYWGSTSGESFDQRTAMDSHLNGALIVDGGGMSRAEADRVFVIERWSPDRIHFGMRELFSINGRPWPYSERLGYALGDSIRWRVINASNDVHPLHLHGFYYRVDARGDVARDTVYWPAQRRMGVTEPMWEGTTMDMVWSPNRPGNWIFHCHINYHVPPNASLAPDTEPIMARVGHVQHGYPDDHMADHARFAMGGLVLGVSIRQPATWHSYDGPRRTLRLEVVSDSVAGDSFPKYRYVLDDGRGLAPANARRVPGPAIVLHRGEPTRIWVVNHTRSTTQVHWHGLEIESFFDGVSGISGTGARVEMPTMPGDSFEVRVTPPRAGSFMYHTHINDIWQQSNGLYGPLIVLDSGATWNPDSDRVFMAGDNAHFDSELNGGGQSDTITLAAQAPYRFRLMNITLGSPDLEFRLISGGAVAQWTPMAKDGYALPPWQTASRAATQPVNIGETYDFLVQTPDTVERVATLELRASDGSLVGSQVIKFRHR